MITVSLIKCEEALQVRTLDDILLFTLLLSHTFPGEQTGNVEHAHQCKSNYASAL